MKIILFICVTLIILFVLTIITGRIRNAQKYKIRSETGIQRSGFITIGGIKQYIQVRGQDISNPVILILHGGPGSNMAYYSYYWQHDLEQNYTIVHWDQRGCGNTYYGNREAKKPDLDLLLSDLDELVDHICFEFNKKKVLLLGHSWGTFLGGIYAGKYPEKVSAYVAVSQMLDFKRSEQVSAEEAVRLANMAGKTRDARKMRKMLEWLRTCQKLDRSEAAAFLKFRQLKEKYLPAQYGGMMGNLCLFSPYMTFRDLKWMMSFDRRIESNSELYRGLLSDGSLSMYDYSLKYEIPVIIIAGDSDWTTPFSMARDYFNTLCAPDKKFIIIANTGHIPFIDKPKEFSEVLLAALSEVKERNGFE